MNKPMYKVKPEAWTVKDKSAPEGVSTVTKIAVRDEAGRFHAATNFRGSVLRG